MMRLLSPLRIAVCRVSAVPLTLCALAGSPALLAAAQTSHTSHKSTTRGSAAKSHTASKSHPQHATAHGKSAPSKSAAKSHGSTRGGHHTGAAAKSSGHGHATSRRHAPPTARAIRLATAFHASEQLRPMAQQLASTRSAAAFAGVQNYAAAHPGDGASAADLALGHAFALDHRYPEAVASFRRAGSSDALGDYADYLGAQAAIRANQLDVAAALLKGFADRHPDSIFVATAPILLATIAIQQGNGAQALAALEPLRATPTANAPDFRYALGRAYQVAGDTAQATAAYRELYTRQPLSGEAAQARQQLAAMNIPLTAAELKIHADQLFNAHRYDAAATEYQALRQDDSSLSQADRNALQIYSAVCDLRLKRASRHEVEQLPVTDDDSAALKMYMLAELSRSEGDRGTHDSLIGQMVDRFPHSRWTEEALYSGGNMYLLLHDANQTIYHYKLLVQLFPQSTYAPSAHWRMAWVNYRTRQYAEAARLMEEQITRYPGGQEIPSALYWRARILEDEEHRLPEAAAYYQALSSAYTNFYYALLARQRLAVIGHRDIPTLDLLSSVKAPVVPDLTDEIPEDDPHVIKARLLANASLNEYIGPEIDAADGSDEWGALAQAQIYNSFGETTRALQSMKHSGLPFFALPVDQVPVEYWHILFPRPYWPELVADSQSNGLDPYLVASLIRQESEFNPSVVSRANAYGLMQLLPGVGKALAKKRGMRGFNANSLLNPSTNLALGTMNLREVLGRYGNQPEYALAAYNAGDVPVRQWMGYGDYKDTPEFVESIPYSETREYVEAITRNREMYRTLYGSPR